MGFYEDAKGVIILNGAKEGRKTLTGRRQIIKGQGGRDVVHRPAQFS